MATMAVEVRGGGHAGGSTCRPRSLSPAALLPPPAPARLLLRCSARGCDKAFTKPSKLLQHERTHTGERPFACQHDGCGASFGRKDHLDRHAQTHLDEDDDNNDDGRGAVTMRRRPFRCEYKAGSVECGKRFLTAQHLRRHKDETHDDARAVGMSTTDDEDDEREEVAVAESGRGDDASSSVMGQHGVSGKKKRGGKRSRAGGEGAYQCDVPDCELSFTKRKHLRTHIAVSHAVRVPVPVPAAAQGDGEDITSPLFPCSHPGCLKQFPTHSKRAAHLRTAHDAHRYMCTLPHESGDVIFFSTWSDLQRHQRDVHPPRCHWPGCKDKVFKTRENLKAHLRRHMEKERHLQDQGLVLPPSFSTISGPTGRVAQTSMAFECPECDKAFASKYARDVHTKTVHLGQRDYACKNAGCDKRYGHKHLVVRHARVCPFRLTHGDARADGKGEGEDDEDEADDEEEAAGGDEEDMDDDFFRREGGAVPEESASRGRVRKRKLDADEGAPKSFLVDLLTGRGYGAKAAPKKRRLAKGRILACPWSKISAELAKRGGESSSSSSSAGITCDYRFSRVYDVQRHLASKHQVDLSQLEIRALLTSEERQALPNPRPSVPQRDQTLYTYDDSDISDRESN